ERRVLRERDQLESTLRVLSGSLSRTALDARNDSVLAAGFEYLVHRRDVLWLFLVEVGLQTEPQRKVGRADIYPVQTGSRRDLFDPLHALARLDHDEAQHAIAHDGDVAAHAHHQRSPDRPERPDPFREIAARRDSLLRLFG